MPKDRDIYLHKQKTARFLERHIFEYYGIACIYLDVLNWGYTTTAFYIKSHPLNYLARISDQTPGKKEAIAKEIKLADYLRNVVPTSAYVQDKNGKYINVFQDRLLRLSKFVQGVNPFSLTQNEINQTVLHLKAIHKKTPQNMPPDIAKLIPQLAGYPSKEKFRLLHGDPTPSNILVSYGKVVGILDFELACFGPVEYDLAMCLVFSWFRMQGVSYEDVVKPALAIYNDKTLDLTLLLNFSKTHLQSHLANIKAHKEKYDDLTKWEEEMAFTTRKIKELTS